MLRAIATAGTGLSRISEAVYRHESGSRIAMPYASEIDGGWWMGSYEGRFDEALLLCESGTATVSLHLSRALVAKHLANLGRSGGRVIFHVDRYAGGFALRLLGGGAVPLKPFDPVADAVRLGAKA